MANGVGGVQKKRCGRQKGCADRAGEGCDGSVENELARKHGLRHEVGCLERDGGSLGDGEKNAGSICERVRRREAVGGGEPIQSQTRERTVEEASHQRVRAVDNQTRQLKPQSLACSTALVPREHHGERVHADVHVDRHVLGTDGEVAGMYVRQRHHGEVDGEHVENAELPRRRPSLLRSGSFPSRGHSTCP